MCMSVPLSAHISQKLHVQILPNFLYMLSVAVAVDSATLHYQIMEQMGQNQR